MTNQDGRGTVRISHEEAIGRAGNVPLLVGETWYFQAITPPGGQTAGLVSNVVEVTFQ